MPFIYAPAESSLRLGDDNLNVSMGNSFNSSCSGWERRSKASARFTELCYRWARASLWLCPSSNGSTSCNVDLSVCVV